MQTTKSNNIYVGIDPGKSGGIAVLSDNSKREPVLMKCPPTTREMADLLDVLIKVREDCSVFIVLEKVWARPTNAVRTAFAMGRNYGEWLGVLESKHLSPIQTTPQIWQKMFKDMMGDEKYSYNEHKKRLKKIAEKLYPHSYIILATSDALLIAHYCRYMFSKRRSS